MPTRSYTSVRWPRLRGLCFISLMAVFLLAACQQDEEQPPIVNTPESTTTDNNEATPTAAVSSNDNSSVEPTHTPTIEPTATPIPSPTATNTPTATPEPPKEITICMGQEPISLYLYGDESLAATAVRHALYENLTTSLSYQYQPQGLEKLPSLADGDAALNIVEVNRGDRVVTLGGNATELIEGVSVINSDGQVVAYDGEAPIMMTQMSVDFTFKPLVWADGTPVTAADSVYSFNLNANPITPGSKFKIERTASYEALGDRQVRWTALPGYNDPEYFTNAWPPLPQHQLGSFTATQLITAEDAARHPLSNGPFVLEDWILGDHLTLIANPNYYRQAEGLPHIDRITVTFHPEGDAINAACDIITQDAVTMQQASSLTNNLTPIYQTTEVFEHIAFGINSYGDYSDGVEDDSRPDWFDSVEMRRVLASCIDRQRMIDELTFGQGTLMNAYLPDNHPLFPTDAPTFTYDPAAANAALDALGYVDTDGDGIRQDISTGLPFSITLGTDNSSPIRPQIIAIAQENLRACGLTVGTFSLPIAEWFADGNVGRLFGREFDLGEFAWRVGIRPSCHLWLTANIPGPEVEGYIGWRGVNVSGWSNEAFDTACNAALNALPGTPEFETNHRQAAHIFMEELPIIPLFAHAKSAAINPRILNFQLDVTQPSELWNVAELDVEIGE
ncbi:MAG: hypothetical protein H6658_21125 [Ardenticatenaceae bacterium]|nr:hypothetical protein [Ardenticatenaceae bacterium]